MIRRPPRSTLFPYPPLFRFETQPPVGARVGARGADGKVYEAPATGRGSESTRLLVPARRTAADLLAEWRTLGVRDDVSHVVRVRGRPITVIGARAGERDVPMRSGEGRGGEEWRSRGS